MSRFLELGISYGGRHKSELVVVSHSLLHSFCVKIRKESWQYEEKCMFLRLNIVKRLKYKIMASYCMYSVN